MSEMTSEPSMDDILSSIRRIISEDDDTASAKGGVTAPHPQPLTLAAIGRPAPAAVADAGARPGGGSDVLELRDAMPIDRDTGAPPPNDERVEGVPTAPGHDAPAIVSPRAAEASRDALDALSRLIVRSDEPAGDHTLEGLVREMLRPMLSQWLDARLPAIVESMVAREIARITGQAR